MERNEHFVLQTQDCQEEVPSYGVMLVHSVMVIYSSVMTALVWKNTMRA